MIDIHCYSLRKDQESRCVKYSPNISVQLSVRFIMKAAGLSAAITGLVELTVASLRQHGITKERDGFLVK